ncbi:MAG TPA: hypothetical protein VMD59_20050 [Acidimicrobiales bacterium]|nr:hypothetical protein [Acidimicrobiales bacterium]
MSSELAGGARVDAVRADGGGAGRSRRGTPSQIEALLRRAAAALAAQSRVRLQGSLTEIEGKVGVYVAVDVRAGAAYGTLSETIATGGKRLRLGALLTPGRGYCTGDPDALTAACSLSARQAWAAVGRWVYFGPGSEAYQTVAASVLYRNEMGGLLPSLPASRFVLTKLRSLAGQRVEELRGPAPAAAHFPVGTTETIDLSRAGLPVRVRFEDPGRVAAVEWFDAWGERFAVHAPVRPVAVSKLA